MALHLTPEEHDANGPDTWIVRKVGDRAWALTNAAGTVFTTEKTRTAAEELKTSGFYFDLYRDEGRWMAGESVRNWRPYVDVVADRVRNEAWQAERKAARESSTAGAE